MLPRAAQGSVRDQAPLARLSPDSPISLSLLLSSSSRSGAGVPQRQFPSPSLAGLSLSLPLSLLSSLSSHRPSPLPVVSALLSTTPHLPRRWLRLRPRSPGSISLFLSFSPSRPSPLLRSSRPPLSLRPRVPISLFLSFSPSRPSSPPVIPPSALPPPQSPSLSLLSLRLRRPALKGPRICGISYRFSRHELKGCVIDTNCMRDLLVNCGRNADH